jgi:hypothetical protein
VAVEAFDQAVNAERGLTANEQMHVIGQDLTREEVLSPAVDRFGKDRFESLV